MDLDFLAAGMESAGNKALASFIVHNESLAAGVPTAFLEEKSPRELLISEDLLCQKLLVEKIHDHYEKIPVYSEEMDNLGDLANDISEYKFLIDPLDGTHNFYFGLPFWGLAAALLDRDNWPIGGVIFLPCFDLIVKNIGPGTPTLLKVKTAWEPIETVKRPLNLAMVCYDNQFYKLGRKAIEIYERLTKHTFTTRITGSAACDAALIATGRVNARIWNNAMYYDIAAGIPIVKGAGGMATDFDNRSPGIHSKSLVMSSCSGLHESLIELINNGQPARESGQAE